MGHLTTHVLDTARGKPGGGIAYRLFSVDDQHRLIVSGVTNADGRTDQALLDEGGFKTGAYELVFDVGNYFSGTGLTSNLKPFLNEVVLRFTMAEDQHYHVPLLVSPWSYSTYRGS